MNTAPLKAYAPKARRDFIAAVSAQAARLGITSKGTAPATVSGDLLLIEDRAFPKDVADARGQLAEQVKTRGFDATMEAAAYTWFNRFMALRYMELHGYLDHGYRVLSHPEGTSRPEILDHAADVELPGLDRSRAVELQLDGSQDEALYRLLVLAQCDALHHAMPFLFESLGGATELLLPANLLHTDSLLREMVDAVEEVAWQSIEVVGWLYQFYISEKKDQVIGKKVASEDIPAATQLFTPNWIVKYLVQNSLGAQWLATYPDSPLRTQMDFYVEPAEQTDEVNAQLAAITPEILDPEALTLIDPACGSGHILVEAYDLLKAIYLERGYRQRDVPRLIFEKNLYGLDIDPRAAQLTGFALMMKGRADDRRLFARGVKLNVMALVNSAGFDADALSKGVELSNYGLKPGDLVELKQLFEYATTFGSLIQVPLKIAAKLGMLKQLSEATSLDLFVANALERMQPLVQQATMLTARYDAVIANPPYMGSGGMNGTVKTFVKNYYADAKSDLFACFIDRGCTLTKVSGHNAMVTMQSWMFLGSFEKMRMRLLREKTLATMAHLGARAFGSISGEVVQATAFVLGERLLHGHRPVFFYLLDGGENEKRSLLANGEARFDTTAQDEFKKIPGSPIAYWVGPAVFEAFATLDTLDKSATVRKGLATCDDARWVRLWYEVDHSLSVLPHSRSGLTGRWYPLLKGGEFRRWFGSTIHLLNWESNGEALKRSIVERYGGGSYTKEIRSEEYYFRECLTWSDVTSSPVFGARYCPPGFITSTVGGGIYPHDLSVNRLLTLLNSIAGTKWLSVINPTLHANPGDIAQVPICKLSPATGSTLDDVASIAIDTAASDWDAFERSWDFQSLPLLAASSQPPSTLESSYAAWIAQNRNTTTKMKELEEENNRLVINAYGLQGELAPDVPIEQITLTVNPAYRYGTKLSEEERWTRFRQDTMEELVSYAIGCMMGRYSLDEPGLIYAHSGNEGFDPGRYATFPADDDGIVPLTDAAWFDDDACRRLVEFISVAWPAEHLEENLRFLADNLGPKRGGSARETLRRWLCDKFFKDHHLKRYKKRPIYWLFNSGRHKAFQALVYLHRYNEGTLARMRSEYVIPLQGKMTARMDQLRGDIQSATSTAHRKRLEKELARLEKQQVELLAFDEKLRHYADKRIALDLDDGVKVNYGKFGDLLAEVSKVHGKKPVVDVG